MLDYAIGQDTSSCNLGLIKLIKITAGQQISLLDVRKSHCFFWGGKGSVSLPLFHSGSIHFVGVASFHAASKEFASD